MMALSLKASFYAIAIPLVTPLMWFNLTEGKTSRFALKNHFPNPDVSQKVKVKVIVKVAILFSMFLLTSET